MTTMRFGSSGTRRILLATLGGIGLWLFQGPVMASGLAPYLFVDGGMASINLDEVEDELDSECTQIKAAGNSCSYDITDSSVGYNLGLGVRLDSLFDGEHHVAVELAQYSLGNFEWERSRARADGTLSDELDVTLAMSGLGMRGIYLVEMAPSLDLNLSMGLFNYSVESEAKLTEDDEGDITNVSVSESASGTTTFFGIGVSYRMNKFMSVRGGFQAFQNVGDEKKTGEGDVSLISAGLLYHF